MKSVYYIYVIGIVILILLIIVGFTIFSNQKSNLIGQVSSNTHEISDESNLQVSTLEGNLRHLVLNIDGMYCASCGPMVSAKFSEVLGVKIAKTSRAKKKSEIIYDANVITKEAIINSLPQPYTAKLKQDMVASQEMISYVNLLRNE